MVARGLESLIVVNLDLDRASALSNTTARRNFGEYTSDPRGDSNGY